MPSGKGPGKGQFTYQDGSGPTTGQFQKAIQELRAAVESRDRIIQQYKDHLSEMTRQNEQLDSQLQAARQQADQLAQHLKQREALADARFQKVLKAVTAAQEMARHSVELATRVQQALPAGGGGTQRSDQRRLGEAYLNDEVLALSREIEADENRLDRLLAEDAWAAWLLWSSRQYGERFQELTALVRSGEPLQDRDVLEDLRRRAGALGAAVQQHLRDQGIAAEAIRASLSRLANMVRAESQLRCRLADLAGRVSDLVAQACSALGQPDADRDGMTGVLWKLREQADGFTADVLRESLDRAGGLCDWVKAHPLVLDVYEQRMARRCDVPVTGPPGTSLQLIEPTGDVRVVWIGPRGRTMVRGLERGRRYELRYAQPGMVEQTQTIDTPQDDAARLARDAWLITCTKPDDVERIVQTIGHDLTLVEGLLSATDVLWEEIAYRQTVTELTAKVAGLGPALRRAAPGELDAVDKARRDLLARVDELGKAGQDVHDREVRIHLFLEQYPGLRCGGLTPSVAAHLRRWHCTDVQAAADRLAAQLATLAQEIALNRHVVAQQQAGEHMDALAREVDALLKDAGRLRDLDRRDWEADRCPHCGVTGTRRGPLGEVAECLQCGSTSLLLAGVGGVRMRAERLFMRQRDAVTKRQQVARLASEARRTEAHERFRQEHPDYRSKIHDAAAGQSESTSGGATLDDRLERAKGRLQDLHGWLEIGLRVLALLGKLAEIGRKPVEALAKAQEVIEQVQDIPFPEFDLAHLRIHGKSYGPLIQDKVYGLAGLKLAVRIDEQRGEGVIVDRTGASLIDPIALEAEVPVKSFGSYLETKVQLVGCPSSREFRKRVGHVSVVVERAISRLSESAGLPAIDAERLGPPHWGPDNPLFTKPLDTMLREAAKDGAGAVREQFSGPLQTIRERVEHLSHELDLVSWFRRMQNLRYRYMQVSAGLKALAKALEPIVSALRPVWSQIDELLEGRRPDADRVDLPPKKFAQYEALERQARGILKGWKDTEAKAILLLEEGDGVVETIRKQVERQRFEQVRAWLESQSDVLADMVPDRKSDKTRMAYVGRMNPKTLAANLEDRLNQFEDVVETLQEGINNQHLSKEVVQMVVQLAEWARGRKGDAEPDDEAD